ncbi:MAG: type II toxin-antitoxin system VapC family toxin [Candidatus Schekmanbacteria bacterium]|nr:type II toxin-antitoxin system VapC family toxin [Candidatus Schekmanbacteria bacterium]
MSIVNINSNQVFCDTSFFIASLSKKEKNYLKALKIIQQTAGKNIDFYTTWDVVSETITFLLYHYGYHLAIKFIEEVKPTLKIISPDENLRIKAEKTFKKLAKEAEVSFCDVVSFLVVKEILGSETPCLTFDTDFEHLGLTVIN